MNSNKFSFKIAKTLTFLGIIFLLLNGCNGKLPGADARKYPADPKKRVAKNSAQPNEPPGWPELTALTILTISLLI